VEKRHSLWALGCTTTRLHKAHWHTVVWAVATTLTNNKPSLLVEEELITIGIIDHQEPVAPRTFFDRNALGLGAKTLFVRPAIKFHLSCQTIHRVTLADVMSERRATLKLACSRKSGLTWNYRCAHPGQQHGRRFPSFRLEQPHAIRWLLVSAFLADLIQHIHSLRASGVMSSHAAKAGGSDARAFLKSEGTSCTTPPEIFFRDIDKLSFHKLSSHEDPKPQALPLPVQRLANPTSRY
jgi:hypothetical protein